VNDFLQMFRQERTHDYDGAAYVMFPKDYTFLDGCHAQSENPQGLQGLSHLPRSMAIGIRFDNGQDFRKWCNCLADLLEIPG
jgi:hypothetical protein